MSITDRNSGNRYQDPYLTQSLLLLPLPPVWWEAAAQGAKRDPRIPLFAGEEAEKEDAWEKAFG